MTRDIESALFSRNVASDECHGNVDVEEHSALETVNVVVPLDSAVIAAGLIGERQLLNEAVLRQEVERSVDRPIGDSWVPSTHSLKNLAGSEMSFRDPNFIQNFGPLDRVFEAGSSPRSHQLAAKLNENESY
jgi:hypothetical protein